MFLKKFVYVNWGNIPASEFEFGPINLLSGGNGSGKTTAADAIQTIMTAAHDTLFHYNPGQDEATQRGRGKNVRTLASYVLGCDDGSYARPNGAVGYLRTRMDDFVNADGESKDGREQAQAPRYNYAFSARFDATDNLYVNLGFEGKDDYYFSDSHDSRAESVNLVNAKIGYMQGDWEVSAWVRNMFNQEYATRGFEFGNDPRDGYQPHTYVQFAEPRMAGVSFSYQY